MSDLTDFAREHGFLAFPAGGEWIIIDVTEAVEWLRSGGHRMPCNFAGPLGQAEGVLEELITRKQGKNLDHCGAGRRPGPARPREADSRCQDTS
jgi:hypothetical protein